MSLLASQTGCVVATEACGNAHYSGREVMRLGREVRLIPSTYAKPFVKRHKLCVVQHIRRTTRPTRSRPWGSHALAHRR